METITKTTTTDVSLIHAVINQLEADFGDKDYDAMDEMLGLLMDNKTTKDILIGYLSDTAKNNWEEGKTVARY